MIDGLNITNATLRQIEPAQQNQLPPSADLVDTDLSDLARAVYISPVAELDVDTSQVLYRFRDSSTGEVTRQFPSEQRLAAYQSGLALTQEELSGFFLNGAGSEGSAAAQQNADAIEALQSGLDAIEATDVTAADLTGEEQPSASLADLTSTAAVSASADAGSLTEGTAEVLASGDHGVSTPAPSVVEISSGAPGNGVSDVTRTGTDANAVGEGEVRVLAAAS